MNIKNHTSRKLIFLTLALALSAALASCATDSGGGGYTGGGSRAAVCKSGDQPIESANQCLQDDAACYQLVDESWCTGERGLSCPAGSAELPSGAECPRGARCFSVNADLSCIVNY